MPKYLKQNYDYKLLSDNFEYSENSVSCLVWKVKKNNQTGNRSHAGYYHTKSNYSTWEVELNSKSYSIARIIAVLHGWDVTDKVIDHIDGNTKNNLISNLRLITHAENSRNSKFSKANTSGAKGVMWWTSKGCQYAVAYWREDGKTKSKYFSVLRFGRELAFKMACEYRENTLLRINQEQSAGYTDRHIYKRSTNEE